MFGDRVLDAHSCDQSPYVLHLNTSYSVYIAACSPSCTLQAIYERLFQLVVARINKAVEATDLPRASSSTVISVLDIYGFEVFGVNR